MVVGHLGFAFLPAEEDHLSTHPAREVHQAPVQVLEEDAQGGQVTGVGFQGAQEEAGLLLQGPSFQPASLGKPGLHLGELLPGLPHLGEDPLDLGQEGIGLFLGEDAGKHT